VYFREPGECYLVVFVRWTYKLSWEVWPDHIRREHTLVKDDQAIISRSDGSERPLIAYRDGIYRLGQVYIKCKMWYLRTDFTLEWPVMSPVDVPVSNIKACPNLLRATQIQHIEIRQVEHILLSAITNCNYPFALAIP
jgi:hypothetical protein